MINGQSMSQSMTSNHVLGDQLGHVYVRLGNHVGIWPVPAILRRWVRLRRCPAICVGFEISVMTWANVDTGLFTSSSNSRSRTYDASRSPESRRKGRSQPAKAFSFSKLISSKRFNVALTSSQASRKRPAWYRISAFSRILNSEGTCSARAISTV